MRNKGWDGAATLSEADSKGGTAKQEKDIVARFPVTTPARRRRRQKLWTSQAQERVTRTTKRRELPPKKCAETVLLLQAPSQQIPRLVNWSFNWKTEFNHSQQQQRVASMAMEGGLWAGCVAEGWAVRRGWAPALLHDGRRQTLA